MSKKNKKRAPQERRGIYDDKIENIRNFSRNMEDFEDFVYNAYWG